MDSIVKFSVYIKSEHSRVCSSAEIDQPDYTIPFFNEAERLQGQQSNRTFDFQDMVREIGRLLRKPAELHCSSTDPYNPFVERPNHWFA